jgi:hypothetical protein
MGKGESLSQSSSQRGVHLYVQGIWSMETATHVWGDALDDWDQEDIQKQGDGQETRES